MRSKEADQTLSQAANWLQHNAGEKITHEFLRAVCNLTDRDILVWREVQAFFPFNMFDFEMYRRISKALEAR